MSELWKQWEGRAVDGKFPLRSYLGGSDHSAVFLTIRPLAAGASEPAAIKLIAADRAGAERQLTRWNAICELTHPYLIRIFEAGRCELDGTQLLYVVEEYAEENLSQILPERALTAEEARGMLPPVLRALQFVHEKGFVHGRIQPANIFAIGDEVKLASDGLGVPGEASRDAAATGLCDAPEAATGKASAAGDVWQLGMTLIEVLTQRLPICDRAGMPEIPAALSAPFREIATQCLQVDADKRATIGEILKRLEPIRPGAPPVPVPSLPIKTEKAVSSPAIARPSKASAKWPYMAGLAAVVAVAFILVARPKTPGHRNRQTSAPPSTLAEASQPAPQTGPGGDRATPAADTESGVVRRVLPQVAPGARRTIHGTIKIRVIVSVDAGGSVTQAKLESVGTSKYFNRIAQDAARGWKFAPVPAGDSGARKWSLLFTFNRERTGASAVRAR